MYYADKNEVAAWEWLNGHTKSTDVVLALQSASLCVAKYSSANVVAGHYSVTPKFTETEAAILGIYSAPALSIQQKPLLEKMNVNYVYVGPTEKMNSSIKVVQDNYLTAVYSNPLVSIYKVNR